MTDDDDEILPWVPYPHLEVEVTEPRVVAELYGPDGQVILVIMDRGWVPFGFQPPEAG